MRIGVQLQPQHTSVSALRDAWSKLDELAGENDKLASLWLWDHFFPVFGPADGTHFELGTLLTAMALDTKTVRIGSLVASASYRNADLMADMARTIDHLSGGRVVLGLGAGWYRRDYEEYDYYFAPIAQRLDNLERSVDRIRARLRMLNPGPVGQSIPILIGGAGLKRTLPLVARGADEWNFMGSPSEFVERRRVLDDLLERASRPRNAVRCSVLIQAGRETKRLVSQFAEAGVDELVVGGPPGRGLVDRVEALTGWLV